MLIVAYQDRWPTDFNRLKEVLSDALDGLDCRIEHVGSTAVPGLSAKAIIDLDIVYPSSLPFVTLCRRLSRIGYTHHGNQGIEEREVFKRAAPAATAHPVLDTIVHHLYACPAHSGELARHLDFRDALRSDPVLRDCYQQLKLEIAAAAQQDKKQYALLKEVQARDFILSAIRRFRGDV